MKTFLKLVISAVLASAVAGQCLYPFTMVGNQCLYTETQSTMTWNEARDYCQSLSEGAAADLASFPACDDFVLFARYLALNVPGNASVWVGAHTLFSDNMWAWVNGQDLQTGVPFWYEGETFDGTAECAAVNSDYYYRLEAAECETPKAFVCEVVLPTQESPVRKTSKEKIPKNGARDVDCEGSGIQIGDFCYVFYDRAETWESAENKCRDGHDMEGGELYYPSTCHEFTHMAHHLEASENKNSYWVGGIDISGQGEWTWVSGENVPGGPPYWATGEPSHVHDDMSRKHCTSMDGTRRFYLHDDHCEDAKPYICKLHFV